MPKSQTKEKPENFEAKFKAWADSFLHSPAHYDGKSAQAIINADIEEAKNIYRRELAKRKAIESMKSFKTKDALDLKYWFVERSENKKLKILVHGSGSNFAKADRAVKLLDRGFNVAMLSYRGHSNNPGKACQKTIITDVKEAIQDLMQRGYHRQDIYFEGSSLGNCAIVHALKRIYQEQNSPDLFASLLLKAAPLNLNDKDKDTLDSLKKAGINYDRAQPLLRKLWNQEEAYATIRAQEIIIVHGSADDVVPVEHAHKIKNLVERKNNNVSLQIIEGEGHRLDLNQYGIF